MKLFNKNKKGQIFQSLAGMVVGVASVAITLTIGFLILAEGKSQVLIVEGINGTAGTTGACLTSTACNSTVTLTQSLSGISPWIPIMIICMIGGILIALVKGFGRNSQ